MSPDVFYYFEEKIIDQSHDISMNIMTSNKQTKKKISFMINE